MNKKNKNIFVRGLLFAVISALLCGVFGGCDGKGDKKAEEPIFECGECSIPLSYYELLLSRTKGNLARGKYEVNSDEFWDTDAGGGQNYEETFNNLILENCKKNLAALVLFDKYGLELPESVISEIDEEIAFYIDYDGDGSKEKFNELIADFGVDADSLREAYIIEAKNKYLLEYLYGDGSLITAPVKEEFYQENYYRFKQILISNYYYEYEKDSQGNTIYFDVESGKRLYDTEKGSFIYDEDGNMYRDKDGTVIYFDAEGNILYDTVNGQPSVVLDESGEAVVHYYSDAEMEERYQLLQSINLEASAGGKATFEALAAQYSDSAAGDKSYPDGYYLSPVEKSGYEDYMLMILEALQNTDVGDMTLLESDYGYHIIMRYELDEGKYDDGKYAEWFDNFDDQLIFKLFDAECQKILPDITVDQENLDKARSIRDLGINFDY